MRTSVPKKRLGRAAALAAALASLVALSAPRWASAQGAAPEGPVSPSKRALVVPTRVLSSEAGERATFDLLLTTALHDLGFAVVDAGEVVRRLDAPGPDLAQARELYLGLELDAALEAAKRARDAHRAHSGDLLDDPGLTEAEIMMMRILLDLGRREEAERLADGVLAREPELRLDPVDSPPAMQALWIAAIERRTALRPQEHEVGALAAAAREAGTEYAVAAVQKRTAGGADWLVVQIVPAAGGEQASRQPLRLGQHGFWAHEVQLALEARFGPAKSEPAPLRMPPAAPPDGGVKKKIWYKTWWFWTTVGIVVVGGVAIGVGAWASENATNSIGGISLPDDTAALGARPR
jgi:hypothetical protein